MRVDNPLTGPIFTQEYVDVGNIDANGFSTWDGGEGSDFCNGGGGTDTAVRCESKTGVP